MFYPTTSGTSRIAATRYRVIDVQALLELVGSRDIEEHQLARANGVDAALERGLTGRDGAWSESLAVGSERFVEAVKRVLGMKGRYREVTEARDGHLLREPLVA